MDTRSTLDKESPRPLYDQLKDHLLGLIAEGRVSVDGRIPSEERLAKLYGISRMTARQALQALAEEVPLVRLKGKGTFLAETSSGRMRRKLDYVRIIIPKGMSLSRPGDFYFRIFQAVEEEARKNDIDVIFSSLDEERKIVAGVGNREGVIFVATLGTDADRALVSRGIPVAFVDGHGSGVPEVSKFDVDNEGGSRMAVKHLVDMGHRRIGVLMVVPEGETPAFACRLRAYREVLAESGLRAPDDYVQWFTWEEPLDDARRAVRNYLHHCPEPPTAVFATGPHFAMLFLAALTERGLRVPDRMSLITFGDENALQYTAPPLSSVRLFEEEMGRLAVRQIILQAEIPEARGVRRVGPAELVQRGSVCRIGG